MPAHAEEFLEPRGTRTRFARAVWLALMPFILCAFAPGSSRASDFELLSVGVRARFSETQVLGKHQTESFREYDLVFANRLPWERPLGSGWDMSARLLTSVGVIQGEENQDAPVVSVVPVIALTKKDGGFTADFGVGLALLGKRVYARQDFGGAVQFALTLGLSVPIHERIGVGYRFLHYSDGRAYGSESTGVDFHMLELTYRF
jgi:hypothetical protein